MLYLSGAVPEESTAPMNQIMDEFERHRTLLFSIAYRMLGSVHDAEDILQDAYLRYQSVDMETIESSKALLTTIVTRLCLNLLASARIQRETYLGPWLPEPLITEDNPVMSSATTSKGEYDSISMAFMVLLENLTPLERAVFILREVFDYEYHEIATILERSEPACRKLFSRARAYISANRSRFKATPKEHRRMLESFTEATRSGDLNGLIDLLAEEVVFWADGGGKVRGAATQPVYGAEAVAQFVTSSTRFAPPRSSASFAYVNSRPALILRAPDGKPMLIISLEIGAGRIQRIWVMANPDKLPS
jgi:RNA polymerase sigma-70 factor (ECF subfamily)